MRKQLRYGYVRLVTSPGAPQELACGMALGLFISMLPLMGLQMWIALGIAEVLRRYAGVRISRLTAAAGVWLTNPFTFVPIYAVTFLIGRPFARLVLPRRMLSVEGSDLDLSEEIISEALTTKTHAAFELLVGLSAGGLLLGIPVAWAGYLLTLRLVAKYQQRAAMKKQRRARGRRAVLDVDPSGG